LSFFFALYPEFIEGDEGAGNLLCALIFSGERRRKRITAAIRARATGSGMLTILNNLNA